LDDNEGWTTEKISSGVKVSYKKIKNEDTVSLKIEAILEIPVVHVCSLIYEIELFKEWVPFCNDSKTVNNF
jgi:hypothetical protein